MAVAASYLNSYSMGFSATCLRCAVTLEAERTYRNIFCTSLRFINVLPSNILTTCFRSKHNSSEKLLEDVDGSEKESVFVGASGLDDLIGNERFREKFCENLKGENVCFDATLAHKQYPSINFGYFPSVYLYDGTCNSEHLAPESNDDSTHSCVDPSWMGSQHLYQDPHSLYEEISNMEVPYILEETFDEPTSYSKSLLRKTETGNAIKLTMDEPCSGSGAEERQGDMLVGELLDKHINCIHGLNKRLISRLENSGFFTLRKLLHHFPRTYADLRNAEVEIVDGQYFILVGEVISSRGIRASRSFGFLEVIVSCKVAGTEQDCECVETAEENSRKKTIYLHLKKFFRGTRFTSPPFLRSLQEKHREGDIVCVSGKVRSMSSKNHFEMREYNINTLKDEGDSFVYSNGRPYPIYPSKRGLNPDFLKDIISRALKTLPSNLDPLPKEVTQDFGLLCLSDAYMGIHQPNSFHEADLARRRLIFDEFFYLQLGRLFQMLEGLGSKPEKDGLLERYTKPELSTTIKEWGAITKNFMKILPYTLTPSQLQATSEIIWDLKRPVPMNRLLQGDVGCGKTVVAFLACMEVIDSGFQAAFMVPTELLAIQHYEQLLGLLEKMGATDGKPSIALLTGSTPSRQAKLIRQGLQMGDISLVIGTHTLIAEKVEFSALRIAIVDEQHRFGVVQRGRFNSKLYFNAISSQLDSSNAKDSLKNAKDSLKNDIIMAPHVLAMSATPIPRSLALAIYGDMSLTQITDLPPGRIPITTYVVEGTELGFEKAYQMMLEELQGGGKVYLVYPVIEQSEQLPQLRAASADLDTISRKFSGYSCGLLHGRMKGDEKEEALRRFRYGETKILLATQVIEIGVDVPDASMMVVMNAERFGIAQLHQLRGRVGRGERKSTCILLSSTTSGIGRLKVLEKSLDGFHLANVDLILRGPGDLLGKKQSGHLPEFPIARLEVDGNILQDAHLAALKVLERCNDLEKFPDLKAELSMRQPLCPLGD